MSNEMCSFERLRLVKQSLSWHHTCLLMGCMLYQVAFISLFFKFLKEKMMKGHDNFFNNWKGKPKKPSHDVFQ